MSAWYPETLKKMIEDQELLYRELDRIETYLTPQEIKKGLKVGKGIYEKLRGKLPQSYIPMSQSEFARGFLKIMYRDKVLRKLGLLDGKNN